MDYIHDINNSSKYREHGLQSPVALPWQQCRYLINFLATLESYRLTAQMDKRFVLIQTLKVTLPGLLQRLSDDVFYVGVCVSTKTVESIPERVCHVHHYRRSSRECTGLVPARLWTLGGTKRL